MGLDGVASRAGGGDNRGARGFGRHFVSVAVARGRSGSRVLRCRAYAAAAAAAASGGGGGGGGVPPYVCTARRTQPLRAGRGWACLRAGGLRYFQLDSAGA